MTMTHCELHSSSAFSFLRGGFPEQLAEVAGELEMPAVALLECFGVERLLAIYRSWAFAPSSKVDRVVRNSMTRALPNALETTRSTVAPFLFLRSCFPGFLISF
jgi:hypothetical protein